MNLLHIGVFSMSLMFGGLIIGILTDLKYRRKVDEKESESD